jgi:hypothetical protein
VLPEDALNDYAIARDMQYLWTFLDSLWPDYFRCFCKRGKQRWLPEQKLYLCNHADCMFTDSYKKDDDTLSFWDGAAVDDPSKDKTLTRQDAWIRSGVDASRVKVF